MKYFRNTKDLLSIELEEIEEGFLWSTEDKIVIEAETLLTLVDDDRYCTEIYSEKSFREVEKPKEIE